MTRIQVVRPCATFDGVTVILDELTIDESAVTVHLRIEQSELTAELDRVNRKAWRTTPTGTRGPGSPAEPFYRRLWPKLTDAPNTEYLTRDAMHGDEEWRAYWRFRPAPPAEVRSLTVTTYVDAAPVDEHLINLDPQ